MNRSDNYSGNYNNSSAGSGDCNGTKYVIKKGDTLYSISRRYNIPLALILRANPYVDVYNLQIGDEVCVPTEEESAPPMRPPVITGPGPVRPPVMTGPGPVRPTVQRPVSMPAAQEPVVVTAPVESARPVEVTPAPTRPAPRTRPQNRTRTSAPARDIASGNTFSFNYYNQPPAPAPANTASNIVINNSQNNNQKMNQDEPMKRRPKPMAPVRPSTPVRQTIPVRQPKPERPMMPPVMQAPMRMMEPMPVKRSVAQVSPAQESAAPMRTVTKARMIAPMRIIAKPKEVQESAGCPNAKSNRCDAWNCYQDRERFNTIMYNNDNMKSDCWNSKCCAKKCTQTVSKPKSCNNNAMDDDMDNDNTMTVISYVSRDNDSLQNILDYFAIDMDDLFYYNVPNTIKLKPGCMIQVPGKCDNC